MKAATRKSARTFWLNFHAYLGLFAGAVLALLGVTGSILVFENEIDLFVNPELAVEHDGVPLITYEEVDAAVEDRYGQRPYYIEGTAGTGRYVAFIHDDSDGGNEIQAISVDPHSGRILSARTWEGYFVSLVRRLHTDLLLGQSGGNIVGGVAVLALVSIFSGLYLWWPRVGTFRKALQFRVRPGARAKIFEVHRLAGFYTAAVLLVLALTGTYLAFPNQFKAVVGLVSPVTPDPLHVVSAPPRSDAAPLRLDAVERAANRVAPGATITGVHIPGAADGVYTVYFRGIDEPFSRFGRSALWIDQYSGQVRIVRDYNKSSAGDQFISSQVLLHNGRLFGRAGQWLIFITGLTIPGLYGTGFYLWLTRRRRNRCGHAVSRTARRAPIKVTRSA